MKTVEATILEIRARIADLEAERDSLKIEVERLLVSKYFTRCREGAVDHCSGCATWGDDGQGNVGGKPVHPPCSCGASWNWAKKMEAERDAAKAGEARAVEAVEVAKAALLKVRDHARPTHREDAYEVCYDWCPLCAVTAALARLEGK